LHVAARQSPEKIGRLDQLTPSILRVDGHGHEPFSAKQIENLTKSWCDAPAFR
jgi:hypothetical protein